MKTEALSRAWIEIRSAALKRNYLEIRQQVGPECRIIPMVKADAYGLGVEAVVGRLTPLDPFGFGVATFSEALRLRSLGVTRPVFVFSPLDPNSIPLALEADAVVTISDLETLRLLSSTAEQRSTRFHVEIDTGMGRAGFDPSLIGEWGPRVRALETKHCVMEGCFTHFHSADQPDLESAKVQWKTFQEAASYLEEGRAGPPLIRHAANSAGALRLSVAGDAVRPGIFLYGGEVGPDATEPEPVVSVKARVILVRSVDPGRTLGYGATHQALGPERWATLGIGYGDGVPRTLGNRGYALVRGRRVPIIGRISMDMTVVDISNVAEVSAGDVATLLGSDGEEEITLDGLAEAAGTISYEILTGLTPRLPRVWIEDDGDTSIGGNSAAGG